MKLNQKFMSQMTCVCINFFGFLSWPKSNRLNFSLQPHLNFKFFRSNWVGLSVHPTVFKTGLNSSNELIKKKLKKKDQCPRANPHVILYFHLLQATWYLVS